MAILLFTDFGSNDLYVGQVEVVLDRHAPGVRVIHLLHESPPFDVKAGAHLLAALAQRLPRGHVLVAVVDPGVGSARGGLVMHADDRWFVGPDNGLFSVIAARADTRSLWRLTGSLADVSVSFHGRDLFAPMAAAVATGDFPNEGVTAASALASDLGGEDLAEIIYIDHYGNAFTGLRAAELRSDRLLDVGRRKIAHARVFTDVPPHAALWYGNSVGLVEIAVNGGHAASELGLSVGQSVTWAAG